MPRKPILFIPAILLGIGLVLFLLPKADGEGTTPLMVAAKAGHVGEVERLITAGAVVDEESRYGWTALMFASWQGHEKVVTALLQAGANPNHTSRAVPAAFETTSDHPPSRPLREALRNRHLDVARILLDAGAEPDPESVALAARCGDIAFLVFIKSFGTGFNTPSENAFHASPLCASAGIGDLNVASWLIEMGADPNLIAVGQTALKEAIRANHTEMVDFLLENGADPNLVFDDTDGTALFFAATRFTDGHHYDANLRIIRSLLQHGADPTFKAFNGAHTALEFARTQRANTVKYLNDTTSEETRQRVVAALAHKDAIIALLESVK